MYAARSTNGVFLVELGSSGSLLKRIDDTGKTLWELPFPDYFASIQYEDANGVLVQLGPWDGSYFTRVSLTGQVLESYKPLPSFPRLMALDGKTFLAQSQTLLELDTNGLGVRWRLELAKYNLDGEVQWKKQLGTGDLTPENFFAIWDAIAMPNGDAIIVGQKGTQQMSANSPVITTTGDCWVVRINSSGDVLWQKVINLLSDRSSHALTACALPEGDIMVSADAGIRKPDYSIIRQPFLLRLSGKGDLIWQRQLEQSDPEELDQLFPVEDGSVVGGSIIVPNGNFKPWFVGIDSNGVPKWDVTLNGAGQRLDVPPNGSIYFLRYVTTIRPLESVWKVTKFASDKADYVAQQPVLLPLPRNVRFYPLAKYHLQLNGDVQRQYAIEVTRDLTNWTEIGTSYPGMLTLTEVTNGVATVFHAREQ
jgi:hypothetical protein